MSLEGLRRGWFGGISLGVFIALESDAPVSVGPSLDQLENLNTIALGIIDDLPPFLAWAAAPFTDYSLATKAFIECIRSKIAEEGIPDEAEGIPTTSCYLYWQ